MSERFPDLQSTSFPSSVDTFISYVNISAADGPLIKQYAEAMQAGDINTAQNILQQISNYSQKLIKASDLNKITECILAVERFYGSDVQPYIEQKQLEWQTQINYFSYKGSWSSGTQYQVNNFVKYTVNGVDYIYICTAVPPVGTLPTNSAYWRLLTIQGERGPAGVGVAFRQDWVASVQYDINDVVTYDGNLWVALTANVNKIPSNSPSDWKILISLAATTYPIQDAEPTTQTPGDLWFNTSAEPTPFYYLAPLSNPAPDDGSAMITGYEAYNQVGSRVTGTLDVYTKGEIDANFYNKTYINSNFYTKAQIDETKLTEFTPQNITIPNSWAGSGPWTQTVTVAGLLSTDDLIGIYPNLPSNSSERNTYVKNFNCLSDAQSQNGSMLLTCYDAKPTGPFTVIVKGVRKG